MMFEVMQIFEPEGFTENLWFFSNCKLHLKGW